MATTFVDYTGDGNATKSFSFPSIKEADIKVKVDDVLKTVSTHYNITSYTTTGGGNIVFTSGNIPTSPADIHIYRDTDVDSAKATYTAGSSVKAGDLNNNHTQLLYALQEEQNQLVRLGNIKDAAVITSKIKDLNVTRAKIANDAIDGTKIADDSINSEHYVAGSIDTEHIADAQITHVKLANDSVDGDNIQDDVINSEHYVAVSIDTEHIANENITTAKLAADAVTASKLADNAVVTDNIVNGNVTHVKLANDAVDGDNIADDSINSEHYVDGSIDTAHIADSQITTAKIAADAVNGTKIADDSINSEHYVDGSIDTAHIADAQITTAKIADGAITDAKIAGGSLDNRYYTETELDAGQLDNRYYTETESDARYFNISTGDTIKDGDSFPDNDTTIATTAAINDRIIDLVDDVGGFVPIANQTSFPTANPDVNNGTGTIVSISAASTNLAPSGTTVTIANGAGAGNTVTITGVPVTIPSGFGFLVETTSTLHTYTFHRLNPKATEVTTVAGIASNITTVANNTANINAVAADASDIGVVAADGTDIGLVAGSIANVNTTAGSIANVNTTATNIANVNNVGNNISNVNAVHSNASNINSAVSNASNINSAVSNASNINSVAGSISNVNTTATNISDVNTVASNITNVNNFTDKYQIASSPPTTDGGGNALAEGDLYFDTTADELKVYSGSAWQGGVTASGNFAAKTGNTFTGTNIHNDNVKSIYGTNSDGLEVFHNGSDSVINDQGTGSLKLQTGGNTKVEITGTGTSVTGNIVVSGNVDGRDVAADGTKLDGISSSAIANVVQDTTPQLGGDLDVQSSKVTTSTSNGNVKIEPNGTGVVEVRGAGGNDGTLQLNCSQQSHGVKIKSPAHSAGASYTLTLPTSIVNNGALKTDSSGNLSFGLISNVNIGAGGIASSNMGTNSVGTAAIGPEVVTTAKLANDAVTNAKVADDAINTSQIVNGAVNADKLDGNAVTTVKIASGAVTTARLADDAVTTAKLADDAVTAAKIANNTITAAQIANGAIGTSQINNDAITTQQIADGAIVNDDINASAAIAGSKLADDSISLAKLVHGTSSNNGKFLRANNGADPTFESVITDLVNDTSPQLGGDLASNGNDILMADSDKIKLGTGNDLILRHDGSNSFIDEAGTGDLLLTATAGSIQLKKNTGDKMVQATVGGAVELYHNGSKKLETQADGVLVTGKIQPTSHIYQNDDLKHHFGSSQDLSIYHSSSDNNSYIEEGGTGHLVVKADDFYIQNAGANHTQLISDSDADVKLSFNGTEKFQTTTDGAKVMGTGNFVLPSGNTSERGSASTGAIRYNTQTNQLEVYNGSAWAGVGASSPQIYKVTNTTTTGAAGTSMVITGEDFVNGATVHYMGGDGTSVAAGSVAFNSATQLTAVSPALLVAGAPYSIKVTNPDGGEAVAAPEVEVSAGAAPVWSTAAGQLGSNQVKNVAVSGLTVAATDADGAVTYSETTSVLTSNANTPTATMNLALNSSTGAITGTAPNVTSDTTYNFTLRATDTAGNTVDRAFNIVVLAAPAAIYWFRGSAQGGSGTRSGTTWSHTGYNPNASGGGNDNSDRIRVYGNGTGGTYAGFHHFMYSNAIVIPVGHDRVDVNVNSWYSNNYQYNQGFGWTSSQPSGNSHGSGTFGHRNKGSHGSGLHTNEVPSQYQGVTSYFQMFGFGGQNGVFYQEINLIKSYNVNNP